MKHRRHRAAGLLQSHTASSMGNVGFPCRVQAEQDNLMQHAVYFCIYCFPCLSNRWGKRTTAEWVSNHFFSIWCFPIAPVILYCEVKKTSTVFNVTCCWRSKKNDHGLSSYINDLWSIWAVITWHMPLGMLMKWKKACNEMWLWYKYECVFFRFNSSWANFSSKCFDCNE